MYLFQSVNRHKGGKLAIDFPFPLAKVHPTLGHLHCHLTMALDSSWSCRKIQSPKSKAGTLKKLDERATGHVRFRSCHTVSTTSGATRNTCGQDFRSATMNVSQSPAKSGPQVTSRRRIVAISLFIYGLLLSWWHAGLCWGISGYKQEEWRKVAGTYKPGRHAWAASHSAVSSHLLDWSRDAHLHPKRMWFFSSLPWAWILLKTSHLCSHIKKKKKIWNRALRYSIYYFPNLEAHRLLCFFPPGRRYEEKTPLFLIEGLSASPRPHDSKDLCPCDSPLKLQCLSSTFCLLWTYYVC